MEKNTKKSWLVLMHQIPPKPSYFRVKIWRRLQQVGAVAIKQSVYVMPQNEQSYEDLTWILKEIVEGGGEAALTEARFIGGLNDGQIINLFQAARKDDYEKLIEEARSLKDAQDGNQAETIGNLTKIKGQISRLRTRYQQVVAIDFFSTPERGAAEIAIESIEAGLKVNRTKIAITNDSARDFKGKTWVTRENVYVDRIACAWIVKRFIDSEAIFKFVASKRYQAQRGEVCFDMFEGQFTHEADKCTFEVMIDRFQIKAKALVSMAEIIHDIDLKDEKYGRPEGAGLNVILAGLAISYPNDEERLSRGADIMEDLYQYFQRAKRD